MPKTETQNAIHLATSTDPLSINPYLADQALELLENTASQLAFLRSAFVGSEPKELSEIEQHGLCLMIDHINSNIDTAAATLKKVE